MLVDIDACHVTSLILYPYKLFFHSIALRHGYIGKAQRIGVLEKTAFYDGKQKAGVV